MADDDLAEVRGGGAKRRHAPIHYGAASLHLLPSISMSSSIPLGLWEILNIWRSNLIFPARPRICWRDKKDECSSLWPFEVPPVLIRVQLSVPIHLAGFLFPLSLFFFAPNVFLRFLIAQERTCPASAAIVK